ncbi:MAG: hypothetical protein QM755_22710 [Luteolibacter sp.]
MKVVVAGLLLATSCLMIGWAYLLAGFSGWSYATSHGIVSDPVLHWVAASALTFGIGIYLLVRRIGDGRRAAIEALKRAQDAAEKLARTTSGQS